MKKRGATTASLIGVLLVGLLAGAGITYVAAPSLGLGGSSSGICNGQTITIGALNDLSGGLSVQGAGTQAAEQLAIQDVNTYMQNSGCSVSFALNSQDYKLDDATAQSIMSTFHSDGVQVVVGPLNSGTTGALLSYANSNHIVMISPSSTSQALAIANDYLYRTAPSDAAQGQADAKELLSAGAQAVIIVNRDDTYGNGLANATQAWLKADDPSILIGGPTKYGQTATDFTSTISTIETQYNQFVSQVGAAHVAIYIIAFQEYGAILGQVHTQAPQLLNTKLPWFGMDGIAQNGDLSNSSSNVATYAAQVGVYSTLFGVLSNNTKSSAFYSRIAGTSAGAKILAGGAFYDFEGYDDVWLAALSIVSAGANNGQDIQKILPSVASNFYGLTGPEALNAAGDRALFPGSGYQIWKVVATGSSSWEWVLAGQWDYATNSVTWNPGYAPA